MKLRPESLRLTMTEKDLTANSKESARLKRVLVVSYCYLPSETSAALQTISLVRKLPEAGWKPTVLTVGPKWQYLPVNSDAPGFGVEVIHTALLRPLTALQRVSQLIGISKQGKDSTEAPSGAESSSGCGTRRPAFSEERSREGESETAQSMSQLDRPTEQHHIHTSPGRSLAATVRGAIRTLYWSVRPTDPDFLFPLFALSKGYNFARRNRPQVVYSIGKPFSSLVAGQCLAKTLRLPHVVEFHDPWTLSPSYKGKGLAAWFEKKLERWIVASAHAVIAKTHAEVALLRRGHPNASADFVALPCGFDETILPDPAVVRPPKSITDGICRILHGGSLSERRSPVPFLTAVRKLVESSPGLKDRLRLVFVGRLGKFEGLSLPEWCARLGLTEILDIRGWTERDELLDLMGHADIFLLIPDYAGQIPAKIYEYLWFGRRILVVDEAGSESAELVEKSGRGVFAPRNDPGQIAEALRCLTTGTWAHSTYRVGDQSLFPFSARGRAKTLAETLNAARSPA